jgi:hypothetical protein
LLGAQLGLGITPASLRVLRSLALLILPILCPLTLLILPVLCSLTLLNLPVLCSLVLLTTFLILCSLVLLTTLLILCSLALLTTLLILRSLALLGLARSTFHLLLGLAALLHAATRATTTLFRSGAAALFCAPASTAAFHRLC